MALLEIDNISFSYNGDPVLESLSLNVEKGEIVVVLGKSGAGKSTLLKAAAGLIHLSSGQVRFRETALKSPNDQLIPGHEEVKLVNQDFGLDEFHTVEENIRLKLLSYEKDYQKNRVEEMIQLAELGEFRDQIASNLSGGQRQRLSIARALANEPDLILLDEPFNQLDFQNKSRISSNIRAYLQEHDLSAILVTHNGEEAMLWADRIAYITDSGIKRIDTADNFYNQPNSKEEATFFGELNCLKLDGGDLFFRPSDFRLQQDDVHTFGVSVKIKSQKKVGWYNLIQIVAEGQELLLVSSDSNLSFDKIYVKPLNFID